MANDLHPVSETKLIVDSAIASGAIATPIWLIYLNEYAQAIMLIGGVILVTIRIILAFRELTDK